MNMSDEKIATRENTIFIMASTDGYNKGLSLEGYSVFTLYKPVNMVGRILREICFRVPLFPKTVWFNQTILNTKPSYIIVFDVLVTKYYLHWLKRKFDYAQINFVYNNMIGKANHLLPDQIPEDIRVWTYDEYDSKKYHIFLKKTSHYFPCFVKKKKKARYDLLFVGRDKGRGDKLIKLEKWMNRNGIKTKFIIARDGKLAKRKSYYQQSITYSETCELVSQSKAVLNIVMENQRGITLRDLECLFNRVKLVTTNKYIKKADFYNKNNVFILGEDPLIDLPAFIDGRYDDSVSIDMNLHSVEAMIKEITKIMGDKG